MKRTLPLLFFFFILPAACGILRPSGPPPYPIPPGTVSVDGDRIIADGKPFAELRYFRSTDIIGLALYYFGPDKEVWIFPRAGWTLQWKGKDYTAVADIDRIWNDYLERTQKGMRGNGKFPKDQPTRLIGGKYPSKKRIRSMHISEARISDNGRLVYYQIPDGSYDTVYAYEVETGRSRKVERIKQ